MGYAYPPSPGFRKFVQGMELAGGVRQNRHFKELRAKIVTGKHLGLNQSPHDPIIRWGYPPPYPVF